MYTLSHLWLGHTLKYRSNVLVTPESPWAFWKKGYSFYGGIKYHLCYLFTCSLFVPLITLSTVKVIYYQVTIITE